MRHPLRLLFALLATLLLAPLTAAQPENPGPHQAGWTSVTLDREGRTLNSRVYYPATEEGSEAPVDADGGPYPIVAFGHGFFMQTANYVSLFAHLATHGFIVIAPQFPDVQHGQLADDLLFCLEHIREQNAVPESRFFGLVNTERAGLSGHSMGGGASLLAASRDPRIAVVAPLAAAETNPSAIAAVPQIQGVVYLISGSSDGITPPSSHQIPMYEAARPVRALPMLQGGNHTRFMDTPVWDWTDPGGSLSREEQLRLTRRYLASIFRLFLKDDPSFWTYALGDAALEDPLVELLRVVRPLTPLPFELIAPVGEIPAPATFRWLVAVTLNPESPVSYTLTVSETPDLEEPVVVVPDLGEVEYMLNADLEQGRTYYWSVLALTSDSTWRAASDTLSFAMESTTGSTRDVLLEPQVSPLYPSPATGNATINLDLPEATRVRLEVFDLLGRRSAPGLDEVRAAGRHALRVPAERLAPGAYLVRLTTGSATHVRRLVVTR